MRFQHTQQTPLVYEYARSVFRLTVPYRLFKKSSFGTTNWIEETL